MAKLFNRHVDGLTTDPPSKSSKIRLSDHGEISFNFHYAIGNRPRAVALKLLASDLGEYPFGNTYFLFTDDDDTDTIITDAFEIITPLLIGKVVAEAVLEVVNVLSATISRRRSRSPFAVEDEDEDGEQLQEDDEEEDFNDYAFDDDNFGLGDIQEKPTKSNSHVGPHSFQRRSTASATIQTDINKIKADLIAVKRAGFRVGVIDNLTIGGILCVSIRVTKLGISEEAMQAWGLKRGHYLVLLIRYLHGYREAAQIREDPTLSTLTEMRVGLCTHYKPSRREALAAFGQAPGSPIPTTNISVRLEPLFIGTPLNELLRDRFTQIIKFRESYALNWPTAERFVHEIQGKAASALNDLDVADYDLPDDSADKILSPLVKADAMDGILLKDASLPLIAMQFVLRHVVRCTEFCLVCHCKVEDTFEALKPYVCSRPLCLYQYMALGFGPSLEWEVLSQSYVVDLLVSFCYNAAKMGRLKEFPIGIDLRVPLLASYDERLDAYGAHIYGRIPAPSDTNGVKQTLSSGFSATFHAILLELELESGGEPLRVGEWLVVKHTDKVGYFHHRIKEAMQPRYILGSAVVTNNAEPTRNVANTAPDDTPSSTRSSTPASTMLPNVSNVQCFPYKTSFNALSDNQKYQAVITLLDTLPSVQDMQDFLRQQQTMRDPSLRAWKTHISESSLNLLRWIIASNRSCIMEVDQLNSATVGGTEIGTARAADRVANMETWIQFRFAQGAPDKEQRFVDSVAAETANQKHPTIFAWHGSPIGNWHSIIRQGLRFDETLHGRAFGHGIYMSSTLGTSMSYSNMAYGGNAAWPKSVLKITNAVSLQEVVNAPAKFVSQTPHYVVGNTDWVQTRYLFIQSSVQHKVDKSPIVEYAQDPTHQARNESNVPIKVPIMAVSKSRRPAAGRSSTAVGHKRSKTTTSVDEATAERQEDDDSSVLSDGEDLEWLSSESDDYDAMSLDDDFYEVSADSVRDSFPPTSSRKHGLEPETHFQPGTLDFSNIEILAAPKDATTQATKALMNWYKDALKTQKSAPLHSLGWYIDETRMENMYQWIVELHSFDPKLPLAKDMKNAGETSIVLEVRFTNHFPFSPPFVRVVKPRFLPFNSGGGGHVTEGGAICMELLTNTGWLAVTTFESAMLQVRLAMSDEERPARLLNLKGKGKVSAGYGGGRSDCYALGEAVMAYERACARHGWAVPPGIRDLAAGTGWS